MKTDIISPYNHKKTSVRFGSASDITLEYVLKKHSKFLPLSMLSRIKAAVTSGKTKPLYEVHNEVYKDLFEAQTLEEAKSKYPELSDVKDVTAIADNRSKALKAILRLMPLDKFTLFYIKKLFAPSSQEQLVKELGFTNRNLLLWLNKKLNIRKLSGSYLKLLKMSDEKENARISELSRRAIYADSEAQKQRLERAAEAHRTPEYRAKKRQEMKEYYERHPETAKKTGLISKMTWDRCPEIKSAFSLYTKSLSYYVRKILSKKLAGEVLSENERKISFSYYRGFWEQNPELREIYRKRRLEVIKELKERDINITE